MKGRVGNLVGLNLRGSLSYLFEGFEHGWIGATLISLRGSFSSHKLIPTTSVPFGVNECDFILKAFLLSKQENDLLFDSPCELRDAVGFKCK